MRALLLVAVVSACRVQPAQQPVSNQATGATVTKSEWQGTYACAQGESAVHLSIEQRCVAAGCELGAVFEFGPTPRNPKVAHGSFRMRGSVSQNERGEPVLTLHPDAWIQQPGQYFMVGLVATSDAAQQNLRGRIDNPSCGELNLQRVQ